MAATVQIVEKNGTAGTPTNKTSGTVRFKNADNATVDLVNPLVVPATGTEYSFEKWLRVNVSAVPDTNISNLAFYTDGASGFGTGVTTYAKTVATFATPAEATGVGGYTDAFTYTSGATLDLDTGTGVYTGTGQKGTHLVMIMTVGTGAASGTLTAETGTVSYDEI